MKKSIVFYLLMLFCVVSYAQQDQTFSVKGVTFKMKFVKGGSFTMGATKEQGAAAEEKEKPAHKVSVNDYYIGQTEVTQALWMAVMGSNPSEFRAYDHPVENVSWDDCQMFIAKLNEITGARFRLPTEAEWEFAARGGNKSQKFKYSGSNRHLDVAWSADAIEAILPKEVPYTTNVFNPEQNMPTSEDETNATQIVGIKAPNELGIYDMSGNVWEWCADRFDEQYYKNSPSNNPQGPDSGANRVHRGGSWRSGEWYCRVSNRNADVPGYSYSTLGFRLAL